MKKRNATADKRETLRTLSYAVFALEATKGHLGWKVTDLVRKSGFSRALIYRYLGSSKEEMLIAVVKTYLNAFYGLDEPESGMSMAAQIRRARAEISENPEAVMFYHRWRSKKSKLQKEFIEIEKRFEKRLKLAYPELSENEIISRHVIIHGLVAAPFITPDEAEEMAEELLD